MDAGTRFVSFSESPEGRRCSDEASHILRIYIILPILAVGYPRFLLCSLTIVLARATDRLAESWLTFSTICIVVQRMLA